MALTPFLFRDDLDDYILRNLRMLNRVIDDDIPRRSYLRHWCSQLPRKDSGSVVKHDKHKYQVSLDVQQFTPEEITVKTIDDNCVVVEGKHEEKEDEHGYISRHFVRRYMLPKDHDVQDVETTLSSDGVLTIVAPRKRKQDSQERVIPIKLTGPTHKTITNGTGSENKEGDEPKPKKVKK